MILQNGPLSTHPLYQTVEFHQHLLLRHGRLMVGDLVEDGAREVVGDQEEEEVLVDQDVGEVRTAPALGVTPTTAPGPAGLPTPPGARSPGLLGGATLRVHRPIGLAGLQGHGAQQRPGRHGLAALRGQLLPAWLRPR